MQTFMETPLILAREEEGSLVPTNDCSKVDLKTYHHWPVNKELNVPMLSYTEAVCASNRTWWMMEFKDVESKGSPHPGAITHDLIARVALGFVLDEFDHVCREGVTGEDFAGGLEAQLGSHIKCLMEPTTTLNTSLGQASFAATSDDRAWFFGEDVPGKPQGWITGMRSQLPGDLSFKVQTRTGWIQVEYLGTYQKIGYVDMWLDDMVPSEVNHCQLDGLWDDHTSQSKFSLLKTDVAPGTHTLKIHSHGLKFKLMGITTC
mmetsp:Transcript_26036/g.81172  ORF Transcript_26036/g.81172 Transcript_26036/m.81172 type:complete len:261 (+) Transcript_26036:499-1281(+)